MEDHTFVHVHGRTRRLTDLGCRRLAELPVEQIATVVGRYYAMDRDERWDRTEKALGALVGPNGLTTRDPIAEFAEVTKKR